MLANVAVGSPTKHSRYTCAGNPPEHLGAILKQLEQRMRRGKPFTADGKEMRGFLASVNGYYRNKGQADDCIRFLKNVDILLVDTTDEPKLMYADIHRHAEILKACANKRLPEAIPADKTKAVRLAAIKVWIAEAQRKASDSSPPSTCSSEPPPSEQLSLVLTGVGMEGSEELLTLTDAELENYSKSLEQAKKKLDAELEVARVEVARRAEQARQAETRRRLESLRVAKAEYEKELRQKASQVKELDAEIASLESQLTNV